MKLRRALLAFVVLAGLVVLFLGVSGVFSPKRQEPVVSKTENEGPAVMKGVDIKVETWRLRADEARQREDGGTDLVNPSLEVTQAGASGEEHLTVQASKGTQLPEVEPEKRKRVQMSGGVRIEFAGQEKIVLTTPSAEIEPDQGTGRTADEVEMVVDAKEGRQHIWGKGAEFEAKQRLIVIRENIRMELTGGGSGIFPPAGKPATNPAGKPATNPAGKPATSSAGKPAEAPVTEIECRGPATADGFKRTVELIGEVRVRQGEDELRADRVEVQFAEKSRTPERFVAEGQVTFKANGAEGQCERLTRNAVEEQLLLEGKPGPAGGPARVRRGASEIEAARIELSGGNVVVVPVPGSLKLAGEEAAQPATSPAGKPATDTAGKPGEAISVKWSRMLRLDPNEHEALFLGDVHFARGDQTIECQTLSVKLDSENRQILECKADTDVRLAARMQGGAGPGPAWVTAEAKQLAYDPQKDSLVLTGGAEMKQEGRTIRGERIEIHPNSAEIAVPGAGTLEGQAEKDSGGFDISWERAMQFSRATQSAVFQGGVGLKYGGYTLRAGNVTARLSENALKGFDADGGVDLGFAEGTLHADSLTAELGGNALKGFTAKGGVDLVQAGGAEKPGRRLKSDSLTAEIGADRKPKQLDASGHVVGTWEEVKAERLTRTLTADRVVSATDEKSKLQEYIATGHVALREDAGAGGVRTMRGERMNAKLDAENRLEAFEAVGRPVSVEEEGRTAYGDRLTWDTQRDSGTLFGAPAEVLMGQNRLFGDRVEFAPKHGAINVVSNRRVEAAVVGGSAGGTVPRR